MTNTNGFDDFDTTVTAEEFYRDDTVCEYIVNVSVVDENVVEIRKVDLLIDDENMKYIVDFYFESDLQHISGNLYRFTPSDVLRNIVDNETPNWLREK